MAKTLLAIRRIRLINFHNFRDETIKVKDHLFLIGENQSGKTTVLDAVHLALTAGVGTEYNAASRFSAQSEPGRTLASIILRYDHEKGITGRPSGIGYVAIEFEATTGELCTFGVGIYASSLETNPEVWGFIVRGKSLDDIPLICSSANNGNIDERPIDRHELIGVIGKANVWDKGRYRTNLANYLFDDREKYEIAMELLAAAKAYRALVAKAKSIDDLFVALLPSPAQTEFEEIRSALRAIEGIRHELEQMGAEVDVLRRILEKLTEALKEREKKVRYEFIQADLLVKSKQRQLDEHRLQVDAVRGQLEDSQQKFAKCQQECSSKESVLRQLRESEGANKLAQEEGLRLDLSELEEELRGLDSAVAPAEAIVRNCDKRHNDAESSLKAHRVDCQRITLACVNLVGIENSTVGGALARLGELHTRSAIVDASCTRDYESVKSYLQAQRDSLTTEISTTRLTIQELKKEEVRLRKAAKKLSQTAEILPVLEDYEAHLMSVAKVSPGTQPLYRLLDFALDIDPAARGVIEEWLGPRIVGALVPPEADHERVRDLVLGSADQIEVVDPQEVIGSIESAGRVTLASAFIAAADTEICATALKYAQSICSDVALLKHDEEHGEYNRALRLDGYIFDMGAEWKTVPKPAKFFGLEARQIAAKQEAERLLAEANKIAEKYKTLAESAQQAEHRATRYLDLLNEFEKTAPSRLSVLLSAVSDACASLQEATNRLSEAKQARDKKADKVAQIRKLHSSLLQMIEDAGFADLRVKMKTLDGEIQNLIEQQNQLSGTCGEHRTTVKNLEDQMLHCVHELGEHEHTRAEAKEELLRIAPPPADENTDDYCNRVIAHNKANPKLIPRYIADASTAKATAIGEIRSEVRNALVWSSYAFDVDEEEVTVVDQSGVMLQTIYADRQDKVESLRATLDEKTQILLEKIIMADLVTKLQGQIRDLKSLLREINSISANISFGDSRFFLDSKPRPEYANLINLLNEQSILNESKREELKQYFLARTDTLRRAGDEGIPETLDYRTWYRYTLETRRGEDERRELSRERMAFGSGGEQAVPRYWLIIALASIFYNCCGARIRVLLMDEAFLGIDALRRESLLQFADECKIMLVIATPELDGVTKSLRASTTLLVEKTPGADVYLSDYQWERESQLSLLSMSTDSGIIGFSRNGSENGDDNGDEKVKLEIVSDVSN